MAITSATGSNRLLSRLSRADFALLSPYLSKVDLPLRRELERPERPID